MSLTKNTVLKIVYASAADVVMKKKKVKPHIIEYAIAFPLGDSSWMVSMFNKIGTPTNDLEAIALNSLRSIVAVAGVKMVMSGTNNLQSILMTSLPPVLAAEIGNRFLTGQVPV